MSILRQFVVYAGVGAIGTVAQYGVLVVLVEWFAQNAVAASTVGFVVGAVVNYLLNYHYTFGSNQRHVEAATKFMIVALTGLLWNAVVMFAGTTLFHGGYLISQVIATLVVLFWGFIMNRCWSFSKV